MSNQCKLAAAYHKAVAALAQTEAEHQRQVDRLFEAKAQRLPERVSAAIHAVRESEQNLEKSLLAADMSHREYWTARRMALLPELYRSAALINRYNRIAFAAGVQGSNPGISVLQNSMVDVTVDEVVEDVPADGPESDLLMEMRGCWK